MFGLLLRSCALICCFALAACGGVSADNILRLDPGPDNTGPSPLVTNDPAGPIPEPILPPDLAAAARDRIQPSAPTAPEQGRQEQGRNDAAQDPPVFAPEAEAEKQAAPRLTYTLNVVSPEAPELVPAFTTACLLERLREVPVSTVTGLDQRLRSDLDTAEDVLHAYGYYEGKVKGDIRRERRPEDADSRDRTRPGVYGVAVTFEPGPQYSVGATKVLLTEPAKLPPDNTEGKRWRKLPQTLADVGLEPGSPALSGAVLDAVAAVRERFRDRGYPYAQTVSSRFFLNREKREVDVDVTIDSGPLVFMGDIAVMGESPVTMHYLESLMTWKPGWVWNQSLVENYRDALRQSGLFSAAEVSPAPTDDGSGVRPVVLKLTSAPERTVGGAVKYNSDFGPGVQGYWEHRNITGRGDRLRIEAPLWADLQEVAGTYRLPFFLRKDQDFISRVAFKHEDTDAYELTSASGSMGIERRFTRRWSGTLSVMGEGGRLKDPDEPQREYWMVGLPGTLFYNGANSLLDATKGFRARLALAPYTGEYTEDFTVIRGNLEGQAFLPVVGKDSLVLALRGMYGLLSGANAQEVPSSIRYYVGGGGSVRGYEYQSLGPRNDSRDPLGGSSAVEFSGEARVKFNETWGVVGFVDGGMAYDDTVPDAGEELRWGAGVGLRFYTAIGPVRLDVATPLNPRKKDDSVQIYFSIGQSF